jgi:polyferredoxin
MNNHPPPLQTDGGSRPDTETRPEGVPTDARRARRRQERQLLALAIAVLVIVGGALIALVYSPRALLTALPCLLAGAGAILILYMLFLLAERWVNR